MKTAIIDIGSNSVRLMLWADGKTLFKKVKTTRLGEGLDGSGCLSAVPVERTVRAVGEFAAEARQSGAEVFAFATAAVRSAGNGREFCDYVKKLCDLDVDVISGQQEAFLAVLGVLGKDDGGVIDIGGASTEICIAEDGKEIFSHSLNVGAVRLHDSCGENVRKLASRIESEIAGLPSAGGKLFYAVGGTASTLACLKHALARYDPAVLQDTVLSVAWVKEMTEKLFSLSAEKRRAMRGMDPARADILAGASLLLQKIMEKMGLDEVRFSDRDNLEGYLAFRGLQ